MLFNKKYPVPSSGGFVALLDIMGSDVDVVNAARISFNQDVTCADDIPEDARAMVEHEIEPGESHLACYHRIRQANDRQLIRYMMRHQHGTPFEMAELKFMVQVPMDTWRQWIRHRTANVNECSTRYTPAINEMQTTEPHEWRSQSKSNKQGSAGKLDEDWPEDWNLVRHGTRISVVNPDGLTVGGIPWASKAEDPTPAEFLSFLEGDLHSASRSIYETRLELGVAREQARKDLPLSTHTRAIWKCDLRNLLHFLGLRLDSHAQAEIRDYARLLADAVEEHFPLCWEAFEDYQLNALKLSRLDVQTIENMQSCSASLTGMLADLNHYCWPDDWRNKERCRERDEFVTKIKRLGLG